MLKIAAKLDKLHHTHSQSSSSSADVETGEMKINTKKCFCCSQSSSIHEAFSAFVTFQYNESFARCMEDYNALTLLWVARKLKFREKYRLTVSRAWEPDQIIWENLEQSFLNKLLKRLRTLVVTIVLILLGFALIVAASIFKTQYLAHTEIPTSITCNSMIPTLFANISNSNNNNHNNNKLFSSVMVRSPQLDIECTKLTPNSFYVTYPSLSYSLSSCYNNNKVNQTELNLCPTIGSTSFCPCVSTVIEQSCSTTGGGGGQGQSFPVNAIGKCYCSHKGLLSGLLSVIQGQQVDPLCRNYYTSYGISQSLFLVAAIVTVIINRILRSSMKILTLTEAHTTLDSEQVSIISKIFVATYINMAITILIVFGSPPSAIGTLPKDVSNLYIFSGPYSDFTTGWYGTVGLYVMVTFVLAAFGSLAFKALKFYLLFPLYVSLINMLLWRPTGFFVLQHQVNAQVVGPVFDSTLHQAQLLTILFFAMTYGAGVPVLMLLCCMSFLLFFRLDKVLFCRYYQRPPFTGDGVMKFVLSSLPYAALIRLLFACWMLSAPGIGLDTSLSGLSDLTLPSSLQVLHGYPVFVAGLQNNSYGLPASLQFLKNRLVSANTLPLFVLFLIIVVYKVVVVLLRWSPLYLLLDLYRRVRVAAAKRRAYSQLSNESSNKNNNNKSASVIDPYSLSKIRDGLRQEAAPFTGQYFCYLKHKGEIPNTCKAMFAYGTLTKLTEIDSEDGWQVQQQSLDLTVKVKVFTATIMAENGMTRMAGEVKRTFEVISDYRCFSYRLEKIPRYRSTLLNFKTITDPRVKPIVQEYMTLYGNKNGSGSSNKLLESENEIDEEEDFPENKLKITKKPKATLSYTTTSIAPKKIVVVNVEEDDDEEEGSDDSSGSGSSSYETDSEEEEDKK